jgi:two-component system CheB/CheR fusion protein
MGGFTIVQAPDDAEYDGMPLSAIATGLVDIVLPLREIPAAVLHFAATQPRVGAMVGGWGEDRARQLLQMIFALLRARTGRDFGHYKRSTIFRRIARRMQLRQIEDLSAYLDLLQEISEEVRALAEDLVVIVRSFFRDAEVFAKLE